MAMLREYMPEIVSISPPEGVRVHVLVPDRDAANQAAMEISQSILGASHENITFRGPAYRSLPESPCPSALLHERVLPVIITDVTHALPKRCIEGFAGTAIYTQKLALVGFDVRAYEVRPKMGEGQVEIEDSDLEREEVREECSADIASGQVYYTHWSFPCSSWTPFSHFCGTSRSGEEPLGDGTHEREVKGNEQAAITLCMVIICIIFGVFFSVEHPLKSRFWGLPLVVFLMSLAGMYVFEVDECAWGKRPSDWTHSQGDVRTQRSVRIWTNCPNLGMVKRRCYDVAPHNHKAAWGTTAGGEKRAKEAGAYPPDMACCMARGVRTSYVQGLTPKPLPLVRLTLAQVRSLLGANESEVKKQLTTTEVIPQRPTHIGGAAGSGGDGVPEPAASPVPPGRKDYWKEEGSKWTIYHRLPRLKCYDPTVETIEGGPAPDQLTDQRETHAKFEGDGGWDTRLHNWRDKAYARASLKRRWTGKSIFYRKDVPAEAPTASAAADGTAPPLAPALAGLRAQLKDAQRKDPELAAIAELLKKTPVGQFLPEPRSATAKKLKRLALQYRLAEDGVIVASTEGTDGHAELPVIPAAPFEEKIKGAPKGITWKQFLLAASHNDTVSQHRHYKDMAQHLSSLVVWNPPEALLKDCQKWYSMCKLCASVHGRPHYEGPFKVPRTSRPFYRFQIDLMEVKPYGEDGEKYFLTAVCTSTRYPFLRVLKDRDQETIAAALLDFIVDCGVMPAVIQSDNEFVTLALEELTSLLGSNQIFSTALRPQSQGIVERSHLELRKALAILVEAYVRSRPRTWPRFLRLLESELRHKKTESGETPYAAVHGFYGSTPLSSAFQAITEIPEHVVWNDWLRGIVADAKEINARVDEHWKEVAERRMREQDLKRDVPPFEVGDLVLLHKPFYERGQGVILPQCDGPYSILSMPSAHVVILGDALTGEVHDHGRPVSVARLIRFHFPPHLAFPQAEEVLVASNLSGLKRGAFVAVRFCGRVHVASVERVFPEQEQLEVTMYGVPSSGRFGPWVHRKWEVCNRNGQIAREVIPSSELVCEVSLQHGALTTDSLEKLSAAGNCNETSSRRLSGNSDRKYL